MATGGVAPELRDKTVEEVSVATRNMNVVIDFFPMDVAKQC